MESGAAAASAPRRSGAAGPALSSLAHLAALRLEPVAQPAPRKRTNRSHSVINSSVPGTGGGGRRRGAGAAARTGASLPPDFTPRRRAPPARRGGEAAPSAQLAAAARALPGLRELGVLWACDRAIRPRPPAPLAPRPARSASRMGNRSGSTAAARAPSARWQRYLAGAAGGQRWGKAEAGGGSCTGSGP